MIHSPPFNTLGTSSYQSTLERISSWSQIGHFALAVRGQLDDSGELLKNSCLLRKSDISQLMRRSAARLNATAWIVRAFSRVTNPDLVNITHDTCSSPCFFHIFTNSALNSADLFTIPRRSLDYVEYLWLRHGVLAPINECYLETHEQIASYLTQEDAGLPHVFSAMPDSQKPILVIGPRKSKSAE